MGALTALAPKRWSGLILVFAVDGAVDGVGMVLKTEDAAEPGVVEHMVEYEKCLKSDRRGVVKVLDTGAGNFGGCMDDFMGAIEASFLTSCS